MCEVMARRGLEGSEGPGQVRTLTRELAKAEFGCLRRVYKEAISRRSARQY